MSLKALHELYQDGAITIPPKFTNLKPLIISPSVLDVRKEKQGFLAISS